MKSARAWTAAELVAGGAAPATAQPVFVYGTAPPGATPISPTTAPPVQVTFVPPRSAKGAAAPSATCADAEDAPPISADAPSKHIERLFEEVFIVIMFVSYK